MTDYAEFFAGIVFGGFVSWIITHEYYRKSKTIPDVETADLVVDRAIDEVWNTITAAENTGNLDSTGPKPILWTQEPQVGLAHRA